MVKVNSKRCPQNHRCPAIRVCPSGAISQRGIGLPQVDQDLCTLCLNCTRYCPMGAIEEK